MNVLVTGASGFLGSVLMARKPTYVGVDTKDSFSSSAQFDIRDEGKLEKFIIDNEITRIVHLAGMQFTKYIKPKARRKFFAQNVEMATSIKNVASRTSIDKIVYVSTDMVYGDKVKSPVSEKIAPSPIGEYGASKLKAEAILFDNQGLFKVVVLRP
jgi:nucleoside-diphosphate-sugar epimerase